MQITVIVSVVLKIPVTRRGYLEFLRFFKMFLYLYYFFFGEALMIFCGTLIEKTAIQKSFLLNIIIWDISLSFVCLCLCLLACYIPQQLAASLVKEFNKNKINFIIIIIIINVVSCHRPFLPGTSLEPAVIPTAQASSFTLQYFPYYV
jgi:hypothetical protein